MNIIETDLSDLIPADYNPNEMVETELDKLNNSLSEFDLVDPIIYHVPSKTIIGGHQRKTVLEKQGITRGFSLILGDIGWFFTNQEIELKDPNKIKALNIALNKIKGQFNHNIELQELETTITNQKEIIEDNFDPESVEESIVQPGEIYQLGKHRLMCGDSTKKEDIELLMDDKIPDLIFTDPPYGIEIVSKDTPSIGGGGLTKFKGKIGGGKLVPASTYKEIIGDKTTETAKKHYNLCKSLNYKNYILFGGNYFTDFLSPSRCWIIWYKKKDEHKSNTFADAELAWTSYDRNIKLYSVLWRGLLKEGESGKRVHPTQKPIKLIAKILNDFSNKNDLILDGFGGSGSTLIAAEQLQRTCYMMEIDPHYCDMIINRWEEFTSNKADRIKY